jgi:hypothetical protein
MKLTAHGTAKGVDVKLDPPKRNLAKRIVLRLPESRRVLNRVRGVEVVNRANQQRRWDYPTVIALYEKANPPEVYPASAK